jgi:hypothetical protein
MIRRSSSGAAGLKRSIPFDQSSSPALSHGGRFDAGYLGEPKVIHAPVDVARSSETIYDCGTLVAPGDRTACPRPTPSTRAK